MFGTKRNKYKAKPTNGFPSRLEAMVYELLKFREKLGELADIKRQQTVVLQEGPREKRITWRVDFSYVDLGSGERVYAEAKGFETADYKLKLKLWRANPRAPLEIYKASGKRVRLVERIECVPK